MVVVFYIYLITNICVFPFIWDNLLALFLLTAKNLFAVVPYSDKWVLAFLIMNLTYLANQRWLIFECCTVLIWNQRSDLSVFLYIGLFRLEVYLSTLVYLKTWCLFIEYKTLSRLLKGDLMHVYMIFSAEDFKVWWNVTSLSWVSSKDGSEEYLHCLDLCMIVYGPVPVKLKYPGGWSSFVAPG